jgi:anti-anti-sigma regulatory factor
VYTDHPAPSAVTAAVLSRVPDGGQALHREQVVIATSRDRYRRGGRFEAEAMLAQLRAEVDDAMHAGYSGLRIAGDLTWTGPDTIDVDALLEYEWGANAVFAEGHLLGVCRYDPRRYPPDRWRQLVAAHSVTDTGPGTAPAWLTGRRTSSGLRLAGETDMTNHGAFTALLDTALPLPDCVIDASDLTFIDAAGSSALIRLALARRERPTTITAGPAVARLLDLLGAGTTAGLTVLVQPTPAEEAAL